MALLHLSARPSATAPATTTASATTTARPTVAAAPSAAASDTAARTGQPAFPRPAVVAAGTLRRGGAAGLGPAGGSSAPAPALPPSVARVAARTRLSAELLAAILEVERRSRATLDDIERADALAERLLVRRGDRLRAAGAGPACVPVRAPGAA